MTEYFVGHGNAKCTKHDILKATHAENNLDADYSAGGAIENIVNSTRDIKWGCSASNIKGPHKSNKKLKTCTMPKVQPIITSSQMSYTRSSNKSCVSGSNAQNTSSQFKGRSSIKQKQQLCPVDQKSKSTKKPSTIISSSLTKIQPLKPQPQRVSYTPCTNSIKEKYINPCSNTLTQRYTQPLYMSNSLTRKYGRI